jgi:hypothetical protein
MVLIEALIAQLKLLPELFCPFPGLAGFVYRGARQEGVDSLGDAKANLFKIIHI